jgi:anthranilate phosphoribosyltransferase
MPNDALTAALARLVRREDLTADEVSAAFGEILEGRVHDVQAAGFVVALRTKGETATELAALIRTMLDHAERVEVEPGAIDTCGTGGDRSGSVNVSTMAAVIAAGAGARVVKHGNRAASSDCGSADVLEALGVDIELGPAGVARCVEKVGVGFCFARRFHPSLRFLGPARAELGVPTTFNFLGPLANPAGVRRQSLGVSDPAMAERMLAVLRELGAERALVYHGDDGLDELTTTTTSTVHDLTADGVRTFTLDPADLGFARASRGDLAGGTAMENAEHVRRVVGGEQGPIRDIAVLNAAAALVVAGVAGDLAGGAEVAAAAIDDGRAAAALDGLVSVSTQGDGSDHA